jgi:hypothetical protein
MFAVFSEPMDVSMLTSGVLRLRRGDSDVAGEASFSDDAHTKVRFTPREVLEGAAFYSLEIDRDASDLDADRLAQSAVSTFVTAPIPALEFVRTDMCAISGLLVCPAARQQTLPVFNAAIEVWFSEPIEWRSIAFAGPADIEPHIAENSRVRLMLNGNVVDGTVICVHTSSDAGCSRVAFVATTPLQPGANYELLLEQGLKGINGAALAHSVRLPFPAEALSAGTGPARLSDVSFEMLEIARPNTSSAAPAFIYAPQLRITERSGQSNAYIIRATFEMPGALHTTVCSRSIVEAGAEAELFPEVNGDLTLSFSLPNDARATSGQAKATVVYGDYLGRVDSVSIVGPVVPGSLPTTYTGMPVIRYYWYSGFSCSVR